MTAEAAIALALLFAPAPPVVPKTDPAPAVVAKAAAPDPFWFALRVTVDHGGGTGASGSGTPVWTDGTRTLVLTNAHVVPRSDAGKPIHVIAGGAKHPARYVDGSEVSTTGPATIAVHGPDLCLLEVAADLGAVAIAAEAPAPGSPVGQWGYGGTQFGQGPVPRHGVVVAGPAYVEPTLMTSVRSVSGDSGAGVFDARAELVGVTWGGDGSTHRAVPLATVQAWLTRPRLRALFPRFAERLDERRAAAAGAGAATAPRGQPAQPVSPDALNVPQPMPPAACPSGTCPLQPPAQAYQLVRGRDGRYYRVAVPADCPTGKCPLQR